MPISEEGINRGIKELLVIINSEACWIDGEPCPYGRPEGKFIFRPAISCFTQKSSSVGGTIGCIKISDFRSELERLFNLEPGEIENLRTRKDGIDANKLETKTAEATCTLDEQVALSAERTSNPIKKKILELASSVLEESEGDINPEVMESSVIDQFL